MALVFTTDHAWPDDGVERAIIEAAGHQLISGPRVAAAPEMIDGLIAQHQPAAIMTCWALVTRQAVLTNPNLKFIQRFGVGLDNIAVDAATEAGIPVANVPDYCMEEVSDHAAAMLLAWARGLFPMDAAVKSGPFLPPPGVRLTRMNTLTIGVVGYGRIGRLTARKLSGFGARILSYTRSNSGDDLAPPVSLDHLLALSDVIVITAPLTPDTRYLFNTARIGAMKPGAFLVNVSRGGLVDNDALIAALDAGHLSGAGLDVVDGEPNPPKALTGRADVIASPHSSWNSPSAEAELRTRAAENVVRVLAGHPPHNLCNGVPT
ncbi:MAG: C-terminal binding protein [Caulobacteraceae bacterium]